MRKPRKLPPLPPPLSPLEERVLKYLFTVGEGCPLTVAADLCISIEDAKIALEALKARDFVTQE
jgi:hypothetical protein